MKNQVIEKVSILLTSAFWLVAALARNDAIKALFVWPCDTEGAGALCKLAEWGPWVYAGIVTIIAVLATIWIWKIANKK